MAKKSYEFDTRYSDIEQELEERKIRIKTICFKTCPKCGETKFIFKFSLDKRNLDGRTNVCKACRSREGLNHYYQNRSKRLIQSREYSKANKENRSIYSKEYRKKNKEHLKKLSGKWYKSNKRKIKKRNLKYYQENLEACQIRRGLWIEKNKERIREYNREYNLKRRLAR
ncbi:hypothetical protein ES695_13290 [Candidatus Atribacteria bacterium 1244-E10-H5-B2]|nr:MAG: hypothetical protein ES695_13290 [Candidatus Atribacteria bacterium 1244-E10-H5-B2]